MTPRPRRNAHCASVQNRLYLVENFPRDERLETSRHVQLPFRDHNSTGINWLAECLRECLSAEGLALPCAQSKLSEFPENLLRKRK